MSEDLVDNLLLMISNSKGVRPDRPFFAYLPFGATHAPHQAPPSYLDKYRGRFDEGWDVVRQRWYERQIELGVIEPDTELAPRNPGVRAWDEMPETDAALACRLQEAFAAFLDHTDDQIGRLIEGLREMGELDNTIVVVLADNGASQEGGPFGVMHEMKFFNGILESPEEAIERIDDIGGPHSHTNYPWGWAQAGNSPFRWYKQNTHEGGVHVPMIMHWPEGLGEEAGTMRKQFVNVSDVTPTLYELLGVTPPEVYRGVPQLPVTGHSFRSILDDADAASANTLQYFENSGSRALVTEIDGVWWKGVTKHNQGDDFDTEPWELYRLADDPSELHDLAEVEPEMLATVVDLWWREAERNGVLPLDDRGFELFPPRPSDHSPHRPNRRYVYRPPMSPVPSQPSAVVGGRAFDLIAQVTVESGDEGVLWATGNENSGVSVFVQNDKLVVDYNAFDEHTIVESTSTCRPVRRRWSSSCGVGPAQPARCESRSNGNPAGSARLALFMRMMSSVGPSLGLRPRLGGVGAVRGAVPVPGTLHEVEIQLLSAARNADALAMPRPRAEMSRQ